MDQKYRWPSDVPGANYDWYEFSMPGGEDDGELLRVRMNVSFLLSTWGCIFGQGCPGVLISGAMEDRGCCQIGVNMSHTDGDYKRVRKYVDMLTEEDLDADLLAAVRKGAGNSGWRYRDKDHDEEDMPPQWHTVVKDGACILANRATGSLKSPGCSLHRLANRLGLHHSETKPDICWQIPISVVPEYDEDKDERLITIDGTPASTWGMKDPAEPRSVGYWCTETPDAYAKTSAIEAMVFRTNEVEMRKMLTDRVYDEMVKHLMDIIDKGGRREPMPGETVNGGRPLIPLLVQRRLDVWADDELEDSEQALKRSRPYMRKHGCAPKGQNPPRSLRKIVKSEAVAPSTGGSSNAGVEAPEQPDPQPGPTLSMVEPTGDVVEAEPNVTTD